MFIKHCLTVLTVLTERCSLVHYTPASSATANLAYQQLSSYDYDRHPLLTFKQLMLPERHVGT